ncbi:MAG: Gfo/Idh/MocA family oxidoreductase, partial [Planctomycetota bacterium]
MVGAGYVADVHVQALAELPLVDLTSVCDLVPGKARRFGDRYGIANAYDSVDALLESESIDAAHLVVPPELHAELCARLLRAGLHVLVEKPLALSAAACDRLVDLAAEKKLALGVNHCQTFHPGFLELASLVDAGAIGPLEHVLSITNLPLRQLSAGQFGHWMFRHPQNILFESGPHPFSLIHALLGDVETAHSMSGDRTMLEQEQPFYRSWQAMLRCEKGTATLRLSLGTKHLESRLLVIGPDGALDLDLVHGFLTRSEKTRWPEFFDTWMNAYRRRRSLRRRGRKAFLDYLLSLFKVKPRSDLFYLSMKGSIQGFHEAVREGRTPPASGLEGASVVAFCEKVWAERVDSSPSAPPSAEPVVREDPSDEEESADVAILGGSGFIGGKLVERLLAGGRRLRVLVRRDRYLPLKLRSPRIELVEGDLSDPASLGALVAGCKTVFHLATGVGNDWTETEKVAVAGTEALALACLERGVARLVYASSITALYLGDLSDTERVTEDLGPDPRPELRNLYARSKILCENLLTRLSRDKELPVVILRPGLVIGSGGRTRHSGTGYWPRDNHCLGWSRGRNPLPFVLV